MPRPKSIIDSRTLRIAQQELNQLQDWKIAFRLMVIIASYRTSISTVANFFQISSATVFRWSVRFKQKGIMGLKNKPKGHYRSKITENEKEIIKNWLLNGQNSDGDKIDWTLKKLQSEIQKEWCIQMGITPLWKFIQKNKLSLKRSRMKYDLSSIELEKSLKRKVSNF